MYGLYLTNEDGKEVYTPDTEREFETYDEAKRRLDEIESDGSYAWECGEVWVGGYVE